MGEVRSINALRAERENDNTLLSPVEALEDAAQDLRSGKLACNKLIVITLNAAGDDYEVHYFLSHLKSSEAVALLEAAKMILIKPMIGATD